VREAPKYVKLTKQLNDLMGRLFELSRCSDWRRSEPSSPDVRVAGMRTDWVAEPTASGAMFSPVWAHQYAESYLFKGIKRVVLVSATLQPAAGKYLGIPDDEYEFKEMDSTFNPGRRPVIWVPTVKVDRFMLPGSGLEKVWLNRIDGIIGGRLDRKGIVHTRSYDRAKAVEAGSKHGRALYTHGSRNTRDVVDRFKRAKPPAVLVSPSLETGWDFPHEECRYQILAKVPFVDTRSAIVQARAKADKKYLNYLTALSIIQMCGRGMRAEDDFCETFIIDDHWQWFKAAATKQGFFPQWFLRACRKVDGNPPVQRVEDHPIYKVHTGGIKR
jgi:Rad3-related DNA helicase